MTVSPIDIRTLQPTIGGGKGHFSHHVKKGILSSDSSRVWFNKEMESPRIAYLEVLAQEFFRLIIPNQPETRLAYDKSLGTYHILSEEVSGYRDLPYYQQSKFVSGELTGLGQVVLTAAFVHEIDLKNGNIGLNDQNQVIKIDGDWCFIGVREPDWTGADQNKLTPELIDNLPFIPDFYAFNWLDIKKYSVNEMYYSIVDHKLSSQPHFRHEINQAMWRILLLPDSYLQQLVDAYIPVGSNADRFIDFLIKRRDELQLSALQNVSFQAYIKSDKAVDEANALFKHMMSFQANGSSRIISDDAAEKIEMDFYNRVSFFAELGKEKPQAIPSHDVQESPVKLNTNIDIEKNIDDATQFKQSSNASNMKNPWIGFVAGFLLAACICTVLVALKVIDVMSLGLSLPLTITASVGIVTLSGVALGLLVSGIQLLMNLNTGHMPKPSNQGTGHAYESAAQAQQHTQQDDVLKESFKRQSRVVHDILSSGRVIDKSQVQFKQETPSENDEIGMTVNMNVK